MTAQPRTEHESHGLGMPRSYLFLCPMWAPARGGVPAFNRSFATAMAETGHRTACLVKSATAEEHEDARRCGVTLLTAERTPAGPDFLLRAASAVDFGADVIVGHDRFSGCEAWAYARQYTSAQLVYIAHTVPAEIERYKNSGNATARIEERERIIREVGAAADVVAAVGPRITRCTADLLAGENTTGIGGVVRLDPGITPTTLTPRRPPGTRHVLVLGRTEDIGLKGLDIAARAVADVPVLPGPALTLLVRGAHADECDGLHKTLVKVSGLARERVDVRPYTVDPAELRRDLTRSALCLMPSRVEGFGLVSLEAIAAGTPVLVSGSSGVAELLREILGRSAEPMIVEMSDDEKTDVRRWRDAIAKVTSDLDAAFTYAEEVRTRLVGPLDWHGTARTLAAAVDSAAGTAPARPALPAHPF
ncbi:glycosyltransferase family 4 protein [Streptomyces tailanensis]|uniref:glycosyltransferase family 4 protein n=1 Tax=Streptomyces tailanensis TaxID=2569858 RepID=UPI00122DD6CF|nr:glycosyltransferase family 4 protein [Streptomyces tailanensis]